MIVESKFKPARWLKNPHLQTLWAAILRSHPFPSIQLRRERVELPDDDFIDIDWAEPNNLSADSPIILILHGLSGSIESPYAKNMMHAIHDAGWRGVFMHYRGCSGIPNRKPISYHSGYTDDVKFFSEELRLRFPNAKIAAIGYSIGGSILLNWLAKTGKDNPLTTAIAISVPFELDNAANRMLRGFSRFYQWRLLGELKKHLHEKFKRVQAPFSIKYLDQQTSFWEFDNYFTAPMNSFKNVKDYYQQASCRSYLSKVTVPTLILHAKDDPLMFADAIPREDELSTAITLELSEYGGHIGFISGNIPGKAYFWLDQRIIEHLSQVFSQGKIENVAAQAGAELFT